MGIKIPNLTVIKSQLKRGNIVKATEMLNIYISNKGTNKGIEELITKYDIKLDNQTIKEIKGNKMVTVGEKAQKVNKVNKYNELKATQTITNMSINEIKELYAPYEKYFKKLNKNGKMEYVENVKIREKMTREFVKEIFVNDEILKGYYKQSNIGVIIEIFCKIMLGIKGNFSYNKCDIYLTEKRETVEIKSNCYNPFSLNGEGVEEREFVENDTIRGYITRNCKAKQYMVFEDKNIINALNREYWKIMSKEEFVEYCVKNAKIDKRPQKDGGYAVIRVKSSLMEK